MNALAFLLAVLVGVLWTMDALSRTQGAHVTRAAAPARARDVLHAGRPRVLVFMLDSLPDSLAVDPAVMPHLASMRARSTYARTLSSRDAMTVAALRAAFTGRERLSAFNVVDNFDHRDAHIESLFSQAAAAGISVEITSDGACDQFGPDVGVYAPIYQGVGSEVDFEERGMRAALAEFVAGKYDFVLAHATSGDHSAHRWGTRAPEYAAAFRHLDDLVRDFDEAISPEDTLVVMGDHGHDDKGRHGIGLDVPTFSLYRGPGFARGLELGTISITEHRYLLSFALGLPLAEDYNAGRHPAALVPVKPLPPDYARAFDPLAPGAPAPAGVPLRERAPVAGVAAYLGLLAWLWLLHLRRPIQSSPGIAPMALWPVLLPVAFPEHRPYNALVGLGIGAAWLFLFGPRWLGTRRLALMTGAAAAVCGLAFYAWASLLAEARPTIHEIAPDVLDVFWCAAAALGVFITLRRGPMVASLVALAVGALLFFPTVEEYGSMGTLAPVWSCWVLFIAVDEIARLVRLRRGPPAELARAARRFAVTACLGLAVIVLLLPFFHAAGTGARFVGFQGPLAPKSTTQWLLAALVAKVIIFVRPGRGRLSLALGVVMVVLLSAIEWGAVHLVGRSGVAVLVGLFVAWCVLRGLRGRAAGAEEVSRVVGLGLLWAAMLHFIRLPPESRAWADLLFAALVLSGAYARRSSDPVVVRGSRAFLLVLGVIVSGFVTLAWTIHRLEWEFLYDWLPAHFIERHAPLLCPLIVARYALPVLIVRRLVAGSFNQAEPARTALRMGGLKLFVLAVMVMGIGCHSSVSDAYVETVEQLLIFFLLLPGLWFGAELERPQKSG